MSHAYTYFIDIKSIFYPEIRNRFVLIERGVSIDVLSLYSKHFGYKVDKLLNLFDEEEKQELIELLKSSDESTVLLAAQIVHEAWVLHLSTELT